MQIRLAMQFPRKHGDGFNTVQIINTAEVGNDVFCGSADVLVGKNI
jgi:hypothetical protein